MCENYTEENSEYQQATRDARENYYQRNIIGNEVPSSNVAYGRTRDLFSLSDSDDSESGPETEQRHFRQYNTDTNCDSDSDVKPSAIWKKNFPPVLFE